MPDWNVIAGFIGTALVYLVPLVFVIGSTVELMRWRDAVPQFVGWGYPKYWPIVTAVVKIAAGLIAFIPAFRISGLTVLVAVCVAGCLTVLRARDTQYYIPSLGMTALTALALFAAVRSS